jgi:hypothetical protein
MWLPGELVRFFHTGFRHCQCSAGRACAHVSLVGFVSAKLTPSLSSDSGACLALCVHGSSPIITGGAGVLSARSDKGGPTNPTPQIRSPG